MASTNTARWRSNPRSSHPIPRESQSVAERTERMMFRETLMETLLAYYNYNHNYVLLSCLLCLPLFGWLLYRWNEIWYISPIKARCSVFNSMIPPGHLGLPLFGEMLTYLWYFKLLGRPDDFIKFKRYKYGDNVGVYRSYLFGCPSIIVCSPSLCKLVLHSTDKFKQEWPTTEVLGPNSVITLEGPQHSTIKSFIVNIINGPDALARMVLLIQPFVVTALQSWSQQSQIKALDEVKKVTFEYIGRYFSGLELGPRERDVLEKSFLGVIQGLKAQPWNFPGTAYYHALKCRKHVIKMLEKELEKKRQNANTTEGQIGDIMDGLIRMKDKQGNHLTDEEVLDNVLSSIQNGYIAIAHAITWALYYLAKSPHILQKLREENMGISREKGKLITYEDIQKLTYTNKVVEETIRLANITSFVFRKATDDIQLKDYLIPKGWQVILWLRNLHTDPTNFDNPLCFNPDRWNTFPRYGTYLPFGGGPRSCPAGKLARVNLAVFLHHLSIAYKWELLNPDTKIKYLPFPHPDGLEISFSRI